MVYIRPFNPVYVSFWKMPSKSSNAFYSKCQLPDWTTIKPWLIKCCRDGCPSGRFSHPHTEPLEFWSPAVFFGIFQVSEILHYPSRGLCLGTILSWRLILYVALYTDRGVPFQIVIIKLNLPQVSFNSGCRNMIRMPLNFKRRSKGSLLCKCDRFQVMLCEILLIFSLCLANW